MEPNSFSISSILSNGPLCNFLSAIIGALIGGFLALLGSVLAAHKQHKNDLRKRKLELQEQLQGFYSALKTEISVLWERYMWGMGHRVEQLVDGKYIDGYYPVTQEYFVNYKANARLVGQIPDQQLREMIVTTYSKASGLIDSYRLNNHFNEQHDHWAWLAAETQNALHLQRAKALENCLVDYVVPIKQLHFELKDLIPKLCELLEKQPIKKS